MRGPIQLPPLFGVTKHDLPQPLAVDPAWRSRHTLSTPTSLIQHAGAEGGQHPAVHGAAHILQQLMGNAVRVHHRPAGGLQQLAHGGLAAGNGPCEA